MGWTFAINTHHSKNDEVNRLVTWQKSKDAYWTLVDHRVVGNRLWMIVKHSETGVVSSALYILQSGHPMHGWGHKSVSPTDYKDMPLSLLSMLPPPESPSEAAWRELVKQHQREESEKRKRARTIAVGDKFEWNDGRLVVQSQHPDGKHFSVVYEIFRDGRWWQCEQYRAKRSRLAQLPSFQEPETDEAQKAKTAKQDDLPTKADQQPLFA